MNTASTQILLVLEYLVKPIQIGTNLALVQLMWSILNGSFLHSRGAIHSALLHSQYDRQTIQRCWRVIRHGVWSIEELLWRWQQWCEQETTWQPHQHGGWQPVAFDITTFWRPKLKKWQGRGFHRIAGKLMPGVSVGVVVRVGQIEGQRIPLLLKLIRASKTDTDERPIEKKLLTHACDQLASHDVALFDAGFKLSAIQAAGVTNYVVRMARNCVLRRNYVPPDEQGKRGAKRKFGDCVRPLARCYKGKETAATPPDKTVTFTLAGHTVTAYGWSNLVRHDQKANKQHAQVQIWAFHDPRYRKPMVLATSLSASADVILKLYLDRWPVEQVPLVAKQMLGLQRMFVHATVSVQRLPQLALLMANVLTVTAATLPPMPSGYWDRHPKKTSGRLRRALQHTQFCDLTLSDGQIRKKLSCTGHLQRGRPPKVAVDTPDLA